jgi:hypothetical protein
MYKHILESAGNINWMAISALLTFFTIFVLAAILAFKKDPAYIEKMSSMPLDDAHSSTSKTNN